MAAIRKNTVNRLTLYRACGICGRSIVTTADTPWVRQTERDGKRQATTYFCREKCFAASYRHIGWYDGKYEERHRAARAVKSGEYNRRYYIRHREAVLDMARARRLADPEGARKTAEYACRKRKLLREEAEAT